jgi:alkylhydroperoxidase/carboxymuconolactone decarboxylase family protein YurZ
MDPSFDDRSAGMEAVRELDPELVDAYERFAAVGGRGRLDPLIREFISIAANASATLMYEPALRVHLRTAIGLGATREQIVEVFELASVVGIHTVSMGMPVLADELGLSGDSLDDELTERQQEVKAAYIEGRDAWAPWCESWVRLDPDLLEAYAEYSTLPWKKGHLPPKVKEFIYIAIDSVATHLYEPGTRLHIRKAIAVGATREEIAEVLAVVAMIGFHACTMGVPVLIDEWERHQLDQSLAGPSRPH